MFAPPFPELGFRPFAGGIVSGKWKRPPPSKTAGVAKRETDNHLGGPRVARLNLAVPAVFGSGTICLTPPSKRQLLYFASFRRHVKPKRPHPHASRTKDTIRRGTAASSHLPNAKKRPSPRCVAGLMAEPIEPATLQSARRFVRTAHRPFRRLRPAPRPAPSTPHPASFPRRRSTGPSTPDRPRRT